MKDVTYYIFVFSATEEQADHVVRIRDIGTNLCTPAATVQFTLAGHVPPLIYLPALLVWCFYLPRFRDPKLHRLAKATSAVLFVVPLVLILIESLLSSYFTPNTLWTAPLAYFLIAAMATVPVTGNSMYGVVFILGAVIAFGCHYALLWSSPCDGEAPLRVDNCDNTFHDGTIWISALILTIAFWYTVCLLFLIGALICACCRYEVARENRLGWDGRFYTTIYTDRPSPLCIGLGGMVVALFGIAMLVYSLFGREQTEVTRRGRSHSNLAR